MRGARYEVGAVDPLNPRQWARGTGAKRFEWRPDRRVYNPVVHSNMWVGVCGWSVMGCLLSSTRTTYTREMAELRLRHLAPAPKPATLGFSFRCFGYRNDLYT